MPSVSILWLAACSVDVCIQHWVSANHLLHSTSDVKWTGSKYQGIGHELKIPDFTNSAIESMHIAQPLYKIFSNGWTRETSNRKSLNYLLQNLWCWHDNNQNQAFWTEIETKKTQFSVLGPKRLFRDNSSIPVNSSSSLSLLSLSYKGGGYRFSW